MQFYRGIKGLSAPSGALIPDAQRVSNVNIHRVSGRASMWIARRALAWVSEADAGRLMVHVHEHGIWSSDEHLFMYQLLRAQSGDFGSVSETPVHVAARHESEACIGIIWLGATFGWGLRVLAEGSARQFDIDHDGRITFRSVDISECDAFETDIAGIAKG